MIEIKNVTKCYSKKIKVIENLDLKINNGEIFGFLGPNGAGKTTTINMITGVLEINKGDVLLFDTPTSYSISGTYEDIKKMRMDSIKYDISHSMINGFNYLRFISNKIGPDRLLLVRDAIDMYTEQIERQALLTDDRNCNLFTFNKVEKDRIIHKNLKEIILYLLNNSNSFVWGNVNDFKYDRYISAINNDNKIDRQIRNMVTNYISNYVTLDEANDIDRGNVKVLNRFIR